MKLRYIVPITLIACMALARPVQAENPDHVQQLLLTRACMDCDLTNADLRQEHLIGADLRGANLQGANLTEANLEGADLTGADLTNANLTQAFLTNACLSQTTLIDTNFTQATLIYTEVEGATTDNVILTGADLYHTPIHVGGPDVSE